MEDNNILLALEINPIATKRLKNKSFSILHNDNQSLA